MSSVLKQSHEYESWIEERNTKHSLRMWHTECNSQAGMHTSQGEKVTAVEKFSEGHPWIMKVPVNTFFFNSQLVSCKVKEFTFMSIIFFKVYYNHPVLGWVKYASNTSIPLVHFPFVLLLLKNCCGDYTKLTISSCFITHKYFALRNIWFETFSVASGLNKQSWIH